MPDGWVGRTLAEIAVINPELITAGTSPRTFRYAALSDVKMGRQIDVASLPLFSFEEAPSRARRRVRTGDVLVATVGAQNRGFALVPDALDGHIVSTAFAVLRARPGLTLSGYLWALVRSDGFVRHVVDHTEGTLLAAVKPKDLGAYEVLLPPLIEQRRIVDLIEAMDGLAVGADDMLAATERALASYIDEWFSKVPGDDVRTVGSLATLGSGPSWAADNQSTTAGPGLVPVVGIPSTPSGSRIVDVSRRVFVRGLPSTVRTLTKDSLLLIRTNGNRSRIGNVYRVPESATGHAFSAFQIGATILDPRDTAYLFWFLTAPSVQARITDAASGTTGLGNVSVRWLSRLEVPWPDEQERERLVSLADGLDAVSIASRALRARLDTARSAKLANLLSGEGKIPASYDRFLDGVA